jgi:single-strand DNA-binding protein
MRGINKVLLIGNATRDAELHQAASGKPVANLRLATNRSVRSTNGDVTEETQYHTIICFDRLAEVTSKYVSKGKLLYVEGRLETRQFTDKQGKERELPHIIASEVQFLSGNRGEKPQATAASTAEDVNLDDLPF